MNSHLKIFAVVAAMALLVPAGATAKRPDDKPEKGNKHGKAEKGGKAKDKKVKLSTANVKGVVDSNDGSTMTVTVNKVGGHLKGCKGATLTFDVTDARVHTADNDADADADAADVLAGHAVKVRTKVARMKDKKTTCSVLEGDTLVAKAVHNRTTPKVDDDAEEEKSLEDEDLVEDDESLEDEDSLEDEESLEDEDSFEDEDSLEDEEVLEDEETDVL